MNVSKLIPRFSLRLLSFFSVLSAAVEVAPAILAQAPPPPAIVNYSPQTQVIQGSIPFSSSYSLAITGPNTVTSSTPVTFAVQVNVSPVGVTAATALSYVTIAPTQITFTSPNQVQTVTVTMAVPANATTGAYGYQIFSQGWSGSPTNFGAAINATVSPSTAGGLPPSVVINSPVDTQAFSFAASGLPALIPLNFTATATSSHPITIIDANLDGVPLLVAASSTNANATVTGTATIPVLLPGTYHVQARATNDTGTSAATNTFTVTITAPPPTVVIATPTPNQVFTIVSGVPLVTPFSFSAASTFGNISAITATINGTPIAFIPTGLNTLAASGTTASLGVTAVGTYTIVVTATNPYGTASAQTTFTIVNPSTTPTLSLSIAQPVTGTVITRVAGNPATLVPFSFTAKEVNGTVSTLSATLKKDAATATAVSVTASGLTTATAVGTGNLSVSAAGTYTFTATATGTGSLTATRSVTFTVKETQPSTQTCTTKVLWLQPVSDCKVQKGGTAVSVAFQIQQCCTTNNTGGSSSDDDDDDDDNSWGHGDRHNHRDCNENDYGDHSYGDCAVNNTSCSYIKDTTVVVSIYEVFSNCTTGTPRFFTYTTGTIGTTHYTVSGTNGYKLSYTSGTGKHRYRIEIDNFQNGSSTPTLLGTHEFTTQ